MLTLVGTYLPGYKSGGPIRSIASLVGALGDEFRFKVVTRDRDFGDDVPYPGVVPDKWSMVGKGEVKYLNTKALSFRSLRQLLRHERFDVLYINSAFSVNFALKQLILRRLRLIQNTPVVVAPRGQFAAEALKLKRVKKLLFLALAKVGGLYDDVLWHATSAHEVGDIRRIIGSPARIVLAEVPRAGLESAGHRKADASTKGPGTLKVVFLGRIARMKNLDLALSCLAPLRGSVSFDICGPVDDRQYWDECQALMARMPTNIAVRYLGPVPYDELLTKLREYDLFFLPTRGENYGHAIVDALCAGLPVLISDATPWRGLHERGCGWDLSLSDPAAFTTVLQYCLELNESKYAEMSHRALEYALTLTRSNDVLQRNRSLFTSCDERGLSGAPMLTGTVATCL